MGSYGKCAIPLSVPGYTGFCAIGVFSLNNAQFDIYLMALFGVLGYIFVKLDCEPAPMLLAFILGPLMEEYYAQGIAAFARRSNDLSKASN